MTALAAEPSRVDGLRSARQLAGLSLRGFADAMGVSVACASRWETGARRPHSDDLRRIAPVVRRPTSEIAGWFAALPALTTETLRDARGLRAMRLRAGLSRAHLADRAGVSAATVAHWECGRRALPAMRWSAVAEAVGVPSAHFPAAVHAATYHQPIRRLALLRKRRGLTQREVAMRLGVSTGLVSRWERGVQRPTWPHARRMSWLLATPLATVALAAGLQTPEHLDRRRWSAKALGPVLREIRLWRGETCSEVARRIGVHPQTLGRWESGATSPTRRRLDALELALGVPRGALPR